MRYIYPPRPKDTIPPSALALEEQRGCWFWQPKYDGDRCLTFTECRAGHVISFGNRHGKFHPSAKLRHLNAEIKSLNLPMGETCLDGELLSNNTIVFFDVLKYDGNYLFGCPQLERLSLLKKICRDPQQLCAEKVAWEFSPHLWMSLSGENDFLGNFQNLTQHPLVEGILLRRKDGVLDHWGGAEYDVGWQLRCRKNTKNYRF